MDLESAELQVSFHFRKQGKVRVGEGFQAYLQILQKALRPYIININVSVVVRSDYNGNRWHPWSPQ